MSTSAESMRKRTLRAQTRAAVAALQAAHKEFDELMRQIEMAADNGEYSYNTKRGYVSNVLIDLLKRDGYKITRIPEHNELIISWDEGSGPGPLAEHR